MSLPDQMKALILSKMESKKLLGILKMYPEMRKVFKKYSKLLPVKFYNITDDELKYLKGVHTIYIDCSPQLTDKGLKYLKGVNTISLDNCNKITDQELKDITGAQTITRHICMLGIHNMLTIMYGVSAFRYSL